ncbi:hypothetical protein [Streptomyces bottropensis]
MNATVPVRSSRAMEPPQRRELTNCARTSAPDMRRGFGAPGTTADFGNA